MSHPLSPFDERPENPIDKGRASTDTRTKHPVLRSERDDFPYPITGPIGPFLLAPGASAPGASAPGASANPAGVASHQSDRLYACMFSEVVRIEWPCIDRVWARRPLIIPPRHRFAPGAIKHIHLAAWPCSTSDQGEEESGWALDEWRHRITYVTEKGSRLAPDEWGEDTAPAPKGTLPADITGEGIAVGFWVAVIGIGTRINRIGYSWTAYVSDPTCDPWPARRWAPERWK